MRMPPGIPSFPIVRVVRDNPAFRDGKEEEAKEEASSQDHAEIISWGGQSWPPPRFYAARAGEIAGYHDLAVD